MAKPVFRYLRSIVGRVFRCLKKTRNRIFFIVWRWYSTNRYGQFREVKIGHNRTLSVRTSDWRAYWIWREKGTQQKLVEVWLSYLDYQPQLFIDVGANYGEFSSVLCGRDATVIAIEPNPYVFECLKRTMSTFSRASLVNAAVGDVRQDNINLYYKASMSGYSSLSAEVVAPHTSPAGLKDEIKVRKINVESLDNIVLQAYGKYPDCFVMKLDIEGYEQEALEGSEKLIRNATWWRGIIEFNPKAIRARGIDPVDVWNRYRKYSGLIIGTASFDYTCDIDSFGLPDCPLNPCDVLIGAGQVTKQGVCPT